MRKLLLLLFAITPLLHTSAQYSNYYNVDVNSYSKVDVDVNANVKVDKTITTIDYGALALANVEKQKNRIELLRINDEKEKRAMIAIANNPSLALDYGTTTEFRIPQDVKNSGVKNGYGWGYKSFLWGLRIPHKSLFIPVKSDKGGWKFENISDDGISTVVNIMGQINVENRFKKFKCENRRAINCQEKNELLKKIINSNDLKKFIKAQKENEGKIVDDIFYHKVSIGRANIQGADGYKVMSITEDDFENVITQDFYFSDGTIVIQASSKVSADKEFSFEDIEGRNYYLTPIIEKMISSSWFAKLKL